MFWQEDDTEAATQIPDDTVDVLFAIDCKRLPVDHAHSLTNALQQVAPWIAEEGSGVGVHPVHLAGSQNGWERPAHGTGEHLILSKRTKLAIRVPRDRVDALRADLEGKACDVSGCSLRIGAGKIRPLSRETTLFSRYVVGRPDASEESFLDWAAGELDGLGIRIRKALCGKTTPLTTPNGMLYARSLMLANLSREESVRLQQTGLGPYRTIGCGIFIPHKGVDSLATKT